MTFEKLVPKEFNFFSHSHDDVIIDSKTYSNTAIVGLQDATKTIGAVAPNRPTSSTNTVAAWTVAAGSGEDLTLANRRALNPYWNYDFIDQEAPSKVNPLSTSASSKPRSPMPVADTFNNQMGAAF